MAFGNKPKKRGTGRRDIGLPGVGAGKGDVNRVTNMKAYRENFPALCPDWTGFKPEGARMVKRYGYNPTPRKS